MMSDQDMKPKKKKLRVRKKERTRQAILAAAEEFFSKKPMNEISLEDIAEAAFVSRTTLYNYFKNKDAIFFGLGIEKFEDLTNRYNENKSDDLSGIEQVLRFCEIAIPAGQDNPLTHDIIREFYKRIHYHNISLKEMHPKIMKSIGTPQYKILLENFEEPYLIEFYVTLERNNALWIDAIKKGKLDGTITNSLNESQIAQFLFMLTMGMEGEMKGRQSTLVRLGFDNTTINEIVLDLIASFLKKT